MINLYNAQIANVAFHKVGNLSRGEGVFLSQETTQISDEVMPLIKEYFLKPFREKEEDYFKFTNEVDLEYNEMYNLSKSLFLNGEVDDGQFITLSQSIANYLYQQSGHPHIKSGEVAVVYFQNILIDNEKVDGIGVFKSEIKQDFIQFARQATKLEPKLLQGVNLQKLDKGCLILNTEEEEGYKILSIDTNRYDTKYWLDHFLGLVEFEDSKYQTRKYLKFCQDFAKDIVLPAEDKKEEVMFMNRAFDHFARNDEFEETSFLNSVLENPDLIPEFKNYKADRGAKYSVEDLSSFPVDNTAVSESRKKFKSVLELDTGITIKLDFVNGATADKFVEKGWDAERQMYYYLTYFNQEK